MSWYDDQKKMMHAFGQETAGINTTQAGLYLRLILEEMGETLIAANPDATEFIKGHVDWLKTVAYIANNCNPVEMLDGAIDLHVVTMGFGVSCNFDMGFAWNAVLASNMAKVDPEIGYVRHREDGKVLKPEGWTAPTQHLEYEVKCAGWVV
jgi:predicted HAD superfamily Cof-like phosphohydrolase